MDINTLISVTPDSLLKGIADMMAVAEKAGLSKQRASEIIEEINTLVKTS